MKRCIVGILLILITAVLIAKDFTVKREKTWLRNGAANYHETIVLIPVEAKVKELKNLDDWLYVQYQNQKGYIPVNALKVQPPGSNVFASIQGGSAKSTVTQHSISAGTKGFAQLFNNHFSLSADETFYDIALGQQIDTTRFAAFNKATYRTARDKLFRNALSLPLKKTPDYFPDAQEGFGLVIAGVIANQGLYHHPKLIEYVNFVGQTVVAASDGGDIPFRFFILDISQPNAYACPGGIIFISKGMLQLIKTEAELAFVLAHEIAHVTRFHGMIETIKREHQIAAASAFDELDTALPDAFSAKAKDIEQELEADIMQMFNTLIQGRLDAYEQEADIVGLRYLARAGYHPQNAAELLTRLINIRYESNNQHYRRDSIRERSAWLNSELAKYKGLKLPFFDHKDRWNNQKALMDRP
ncbi:MAG: M48 family metallopeptidase [Candidatus Cloacimonadaceae bacterium]|nr:M48 family metallopeptidase [Candidatus Cloacimonadaceae bacterium]